MTTKEANRESARQYRQRNRDEINRRRQLYHQEHKEEANRKRQEYYHKNKDKFIAYRIKNREKILEYCKRSREKNREHQNQMNQQVRIETLTYYGKGELACVRCGYNDIRALSIDHIKGDGKALRDLGELTGVALYRRLKNLGYPEGYQTLCMNCQFVKRDADKEATGRPY